MLGFQWKLNSDFLSPNTGNNGLKQDCSTTPMAETGNVQTYIPKGLRTFVAKTTKVISTDLTQNRVMLMYLASSFSWNFPLASLVYPQIWAQDPCTWCLRAGPMHEAKHVPAGLAHSSHLGQDREVVNYKGHLVPLLLSQILCVAQNSKASDVSGSVGIERVHESSS